MIRTMPRLKLDKLNRFNMRFDPSIFLILVTLVFSTGCKKKDRLTTSTFNFGITPPAAAVLKNDTITLTAHASSSQNLSVNPTWALSPSGVATLSSTIGPSVVLTGVALATVTVTATFDGVMARSQIDVVNYIPNPSVFNVYTDDGLPTISGNSSSDIFQSVGLNLVELENGAGGYTPEGENFQRATGFVTGNYWGITLDGGSVGASRNLSAYNSGTLKFALRLQNRTLDSIGNGDHLQIELKKIGAVAVSVSLTSGSFGFNRLSTDWQEISIPISSFVGLDTTQIENPFAVAAVALVTPLTLDIDAVRWQP